MAAVPFPIFTTALAIISMAYRRRARLDQETIHLGQLTQAWRDLEGLLRNALPYERQNESIEEVINRLYASGLLSSSEHDKLHQLRRWRNAAVHSRSSGNLPDLVVRIQALYEQLAWRLN